MRTFAGRQKNVSKQNRLVLTSRFCLETLPDLGRMPVHLKIRQGGAGTVQSYAQNSLPTAFLSWATP